jgi:hypothetical protein
LLLLSITTLRKTQSSQNNHANPPRPSTRRHGREILLNRINARKKCATPCYVAVAKHTVTTTAPREADLLAEFTCQLAMLDREKSSN